MTDSTNAEQMNQMIIWSKKSTVIVSKKTEVIEKKTYTLEYIFSYGHKHGPLSSDLVVSEVLGVYSDINMAYINALEILVRKIKNPHAESDYFRITECEPNTDFEKTKKTFWYLNLNKLGDISYEIIKKAQSLLKIIKIIPDAIEHISLYFDKTTEQSNIFYLRQIILRG
jgi:hypothetical protein